MSSSPVPAFSYCESVHAGSMSPWHIRRPLPRTGLMTSGGIDTPSLCGRVKPFGRGGTGGWDLSVPVTDKQDGVCRECFAQYQRQKGES